MAGFVGCKLDDFDLKGNVSFRSPNPANPPFTVGSNGSTFFNPPKPSSPVPGAVFFATGDEVVVSLGRVPARARPVRGSLGEEGAVRADGLNVMGFPALYV